MSLTLVYHSRLASALFTFTTSSRCISSISHFTHDEHRLYFEHLATQSRLPPRPILQKLLAPRFLQPQIYHTQSSTWVALDKGSQKGLEGGSVLKVVSWNVDWSSSDPVSRSSAVLGHLEGLFGEVSGLLVVMF